ncbi:MAG: tetratricopeptide repeat protein [Nitrospinaceae bacterium]|nr:tetratricopeptide repeat protein [Nitrospinaceae bacterium]NIR54781.1 tetratricopeptide repeat protein [Nitrospinaceae bacterium]NIS85207.1 tetratricopeptide repeat protein [Nitrospinaceae bacterium]NIT82017.1 tetratricopeptide repeat protein [Nitrospinaceae bacterium]NIU44281.1 tetratricopeptide repeat protein [Nitrospinaceae bacterium]
MIRINPRHAEAHASLGWALVETRRYREALPPLEQLTRLRPENADAYYGLGWVYVELNRFPKAMKRLKQALALDPQHTGARVRLRMAEQKMKENHPPRENILIQTPDPPISESPR